MISPRRALLASLCFLLPCGGAEQLCAQAPTDSVVEAPAPAEPDASPSEKPVAPGILEGSLPSFAAPPPPPPSGDPVLSPEPSSTTLTEPIPAAGPADPIPTTAEISPSDTKPQDPLQNARFRESLIRANQAIEDGKFDEALRFVEQAESTIPGTPTVLNLRGAVETKTKDYAKADASFEAALQIAPEFFPADFNRGEVLFLQKNYAGAREWFSRMQQALPGNELIQFKIFLCLLKEGRTQDAERVMRAMRYPSDSPAWYYAHAAWEFENKRPSDGRKYVESAKFIFGEDKTKMYAETFRDIAIDAN